MSERAARRQAAEELTGQRSSTVFLVDTIEVGTGLAVHEDGEGTALVKLNVAGRYNGTDLEDAIVLVATPALARTLAPLLETAADTAEALVPDEPTDNRHPPPAGAPTEEGPPTG